MLDDTDIRARERAGSANIRSFYNEIGWREKPSGVLLDTDLFGDKEVGEIRREAHALRVRRIRDAIGAAGRALKLIECGCGGNPALFLADLCAEYTGVDFSVTGLKVTRKKLEAAGVNGRVLLCDVGWLPFPDGSFDVAYSAHMLYHIPSAEGQTAAFGEIMRVVRPGGLALFVLVNPQPLLFPVRLVRRLVAETPGLSSLADRLRRKPLLPYHPMTLGWIGRQLGRYGKVRIEGHALASNWFNRHVSELRNPGTMIWKMILWLERDHPGWAARLGNYVCILVERSEG
jgi:ubiquinone/menaquinone biosynthesis C-methylase UbiE